MRTPPPASLHLIPKLLTPAQTLTHHFALVLVELLPSALALLLTKLPCRLNNLSRCSGSHRANCLGGVGHQHRIGLVMFAALWVLRVAFVVVVAGHN